LRIVHASDPDRAVWESAPGVGFVAAAAGEATVKEQRGSFEIADREVRRCDEQSVDSVDPAPGRLVLRGRLGGEGCDAAYALTFASPSANQLAFDLAVEGEGLNRSFLRYASSADERFFGFGEQFTFLDMKGRRVPIIVQEQGIGRGLEPITSVLNLFSPGSGGGPFSTYAAVPQYVTSRSRSLFLENSEYAEFDLTAPDRVEVKLFAPEMRGRILNGARPLDLIEEYTAYAGRMAPLPDWLNEGAVAGMQGGTARVREIWAQLRARGAPLAAFWLQDWVGRRQTIIGSQLWWNWELDRERYPGWESLVADLGAAGTRVMTYVNPFLVDVSERGTFGRNLFAEARDLGYLATREDGTPYLIPNTSFSAAILDLTNPDAFAWMKDVLRDQVLGAGAYGWMADFGEALPYDAVLASGEPASAFHNRYAEEWARLNREVLEDAGREGDVVFFSRSGYSRSPAYSTLFWLGDQLVTFDGDDGLKSAIKGMLSGGFSGYALNHSDVGGYTTFNILIARYYRSKELLLRWMEHSAFTSVFRTHEGNQPENNVQFYSDEETYDAFAKWAKVFRALAFYRRGLMEEAADKGWPMARHPFLEFPEDPNTLGLLHQYMMGSEFMVAPVADPGAATVSVYLPAGDWVHVWTGEPYASDGETFLVDAPLGTPAVFYKEGSPAGEPS
ncbi:MAG: alpha-glucosidase, partial [Candidatus Methylomirabilis sp.]|nr:alpha-glucosidase [Deltaproteobacteria bacterium]